jgi:hypothetical protein
MYVKLLLAPTEGEYASHVLEFVFIGAAECEVRGNDKCILESGYLISMQQLSRFTLTPSHYAWTRRRKKTFRNFFEPNKVGSLSEF